VYVAVDGKVYDVTNSSVWKNGMHQGMAAGVDLSAFISQSPHGKGILSSLRVVGTME
jgi:predicted heme/steroid binding protein